MKMREVNDEMVMRLFHLTKSGDQWSAEKEKIESGRICQKVIFQVEHEMENEKEQGVDGEERCKCQPCPYSFVACLKVENSIEPEDDEKTICLMFFILRHDVLASILTHTVM